MQPINREHAGIVALKLEEALARADYRYVQAEMKLARATQELAEAQMGIEALRLSLEGVKALLGVQCERKSNV